MLGMTYTDEILRGLENPHADEAANLLRRSAELYAIADATEDPERRGRLYNVAQREKQTARVHALLGLNYAVGVLAEHIAPSRLEVTVTAEEGLTEQAATTIREAIDGYAAMRGVQ